LGLHAANPTLLQLFKQHNAGASCESETLFSYRYACI
jgi:hypothetical protein